MYSGHNDMNESVCYVGFKNRKYTSLVAAEFLKSRMEKII